MTVGTDPDMFTPYPVYRPDLFLAAVTEHLHVGLGLVDQCLEIGGHSCWERGKPGRCSKRKHGQLARLVNPEYPTSTKIRAAAHQIISPGGGDCIHAGHGSKAPVDEQDRRSARRVIDPHLLKVPGDIRWRARVADGELCWPEHPSLFRACALVEFNKDQVGLPTRTARIDVGEIQQGPHPLLSGISRVRRHPWPD